MQPIFCYEKSNYGEWIPVVYHDGRPPKSANSSDKERLAFHEITPDDLGSDGISPDFKKLMEKYPI